MSSCGTSHQFPGGYKGLAGRFAVSSLNSGARFAPMWTTRRRDLRGTADGARYLEGTVFERERIVPRVVLRPSHLHDSQATLHEQVRGRMHFEGKDTVREVRLFGRGPAGSQLERSLRNQEGERAEVPQPFEEKVELGPPVLHLRHGLEDVERVDDQDRNRIRFHHVLAVHLEQFEPAAATLEEVQVLPDVPHVEGHDL